MYQSEHGIGIERSEDGAELTIRVGTRLDLQARSALRDTYQQLETGHSRVVIDLASTDHMDSSAFGILLLLRERAGGDKSEISIVHCQPNVRDLLLLGNMDRLFEIT